MRRHTVVLAGALLAIVVAGCGASNTPTSQPPTGSRPTPTAVPQTLALYAEAAKPTLDDSISMVKQLLAQLRSTSDWSSIATDCSTIGPTLANFYSAFQSAVGPSGALVAYRPAGIGYKYALSAIDECGMAADTASKAQLKVAYYDMKYGQYKMAKASAALSLWAQASHS